VIFIYSKVRSSVTDKSSKFEQGFGSDIFSSNVSVFCWICEKSEFSFALCEAFARVSRERLHINNFLKEYFLRTR
jgi:hypothetical protein